MATRSRRFTAVPFQGVRNDVHIGHGAWRCGPNIMRYTSNVVLSPNKFDRRDGALLRDKLEVLRILAFPAAERAAEPQPVRSACDTLRFRRGPTGPSAEDVNK